MCPVRQIPALDSVADFETLKNLVFFRESEEFAAILLDPEFNELYESFEVLA